MGFETDISLNEVVWGLVARHSQKRPFI